jgi:hypothetical protein
MNLVIGVIIVTVIGVSLLAAAIYAVDKNADRRDHAQGQ